MASTKENSYFENFHLLPFKIPSFLFLKQSLDVVSQRRILQILIQIFPSVSSVMMLLHTRSWNSNPHPYLTLRYWANVFWRVLISILILRLYGTSSTIFIWTTCYVSCWTRQLAPPQDIRFSQLICGIKLRPYIKSVAGGVREQNCKVVLPFPLINSKGW